MAKGRMMKHHLDGLPECIRVIGWVIVGGICVVIVAVLAVMNALTPMGIFRASFWGF